MWVFVSKARLRTRVTAACGQGCKIAKYRTPAYLRESWGRGALHWRLAADAAFNSADKVTGVSTAQVVSAKRAWYSRLASTARS